MSQHACTAVVSECVTTCSYTKQEMRSVQKRVSVPSEVTLPLSCCGKLLECSLACVYNNILAPTPTCIPYNMADTTCILDGVHP